MIADEPIASLDVSIQAQIVNLFRHLQRSHGFSILFIAHDLAMVEFLCDRVGVMYHGRLVEVAPCKELYQNPLHPYTKVLLAAIPVPDPELERSRSIPVFSDQAFLTDGELKRSTAGTFCTARQDEKLNADKHSPDSSARSDCVHEQVAKLVHRTANNCTT